MKVLTYLKVLFCAPVFIFQISCVPHHQVLEKQFKKNDLLSAIVFNPDYEVQIIYTLVHPRTGKPETYHFQVNSARYFYPASTVKMPVAFLAIEKIRQLQQSGYLLNPETTMLHQASTIPQTTSFSDETSMNKLPSVKRYVEKIFLVSDNDAYNRLYEFLGQDSINEILRRKKVFTSSVINHRLGVQQYDAEDNRRANPVEFRENGHMVYSIPERLTTTIYRHQARQAIKGNGYLDLSGRLIEKPFDFTGKNFYQLEDLHKTLMRIMNPEWFPPEERFQILPEDYRFLRETMKKLPRQDFWYAQDTTLHDSYVKFFMFGDTKDTIPDHIHIYNKPGCAYGYLLDCAYIEDTKEGVSFFLTAVIHVNKNKIYNDGLYEYDSVGYPFFAELGRVMYQFSKKKQ